eukprot:1323405-Amorphochlora_amoeboformis.AAC.1
MACGHMHRLVASRDKNDWNGNQELGFYPTPGARSDCWKAEVARPSRQRATAAAAKRKARMDGYPQAPRVVDEQVGDVKSII